MSWKFFTPFFAFVIAIFFAIQEVNSETGISIMTIIEEIIQ